MNEKLYEGVTFCGFVAYEVGYLVVDDVEVGYGGCNLFSPHPFGKLRAGSSPLPRGEGTLNGGFVLALPLWIPACAGKTVSGGFAFGVGEAVADKVLSGFEAVVELGVGVLSLHGVEEELGDRVAFLCAVDDVLL